MTCHLKVGVDGVKLFGVLWQLSPDVLRADEDALEVGSGALHLEPDSDDRVRGGQLLPPVGDLLKEVAH